MFFVDLDETINVKAKKHTLLQIVHKGISLLMNIKSKVAPKTEFCLVALTNTAILMHELTSNSNELQIRMADDEVQGRFRELGSIFLFFCQKTNKISKNTSN